VTTVKQATPTPTPTATPTPKVVTTVKQATPTPTPTATPTPAAATLVTTKSAPEVVANDSVPEVSVPAAQTSGVASLPPQPVLEFSLLGLGIPALVAGLVYLLMRR
ncbi:MAG: hypothetical protein WCI87_07885, partial [Euryarchaeota archaeon]